MVVRPATVLVPPVVGIFNTKVPAPLAWVQSPTISSLMPKRPGPVTGCPLTVPVQVAVPVRPWETIATWRSRGVNPGGRSLLTVVVQARLTTRAAALAGAAGTDSA